MLMGEERQQNVKEGQLSSFMHCAGASDESVLGAILGSRRIGGALKR